MASDNTKIKLIADVAVFAERKVLLVKYKDANKYDHQKGWFLPDDDIIHGEHPGEAANRILKEQLSVNESQDLKLHHIESFTGNDRSWHLVFHFMLYIENMNLVNISSEIDEVNWFHPDTLPDEKEIAHHGWAKYTLKNIEDNLI
jgi:ADP-ribose pyrophosphatase YjhB (NUDIX family)